MTIENSLNLEQTSNKEVFVYTGNKLTLDCFQKIVQDRYFLSLSNDVSSKIQQSRKVVEKILTDGEVRYGVNTGFGQLCNHVIDNSSLEDLQTNLILSHATGVGEPFSEEIVRGIMLLRIISLCQGYSGIRLSTLQLLIDMLNHEVHPIIPSKGSLGASGDLCPLSHMTLVMLGRGSAVFNGKIVTGEVALKEAGLFPIKLAAKEGLALINGTQAINSVAAVTLLRTRNLLKVADICTSLTIEALGGLLDPFQDRVAKLRPHPGLGLVSSNITKLCSGSSLLSQREPRVQDAYSLRCVPQVHGASRDAFQHVLDVVETEFNSVTDNPLVFPEGDIVSAGHFHGQPLALPMDYLCIALSELASISERRIERLVNPSLSFGLPPFLTERSGLNSGFMIAHYTCAALVSENKILSHPATVDSIPTSANQEDHVSMGTIAARKALTITEHVLTVLATELLCACQGIDIRIKRTNAQPSPANLRAFEIVRSVVSKLEDDRELHVDVRRAQELVSSGKLVRELESIVGIL
ncbi:hypothetical protein RCL1_000001 [Eukaryota sp. TZLM3-RCL]